MKRGHTHLAVLTPIAGATPSESRARAGELANLFRGDCWTGIYERIFGRCPMVHMARFQIIDRTTPGMGERAQIGATAKFLFFAADLDGIAEDFYDHLYRFDQTYAMRRMGDGGFVRTVWGNCSEFPMAEGEVYFRRYMRRFEIPPGIVYSGAHASVREIFEALLVQALWREFPRMHGGPLSTSDAWSALKRVLGALPSLPTDELVELLDRLNGDRAPQFVGPFHFHDAIVHIEQLLASTAMVDPMAGQADES